MTAPGDTQTRLVLRPLDVADPRLDLDERSLVLASRNAYPAVAAVPRRSDSLGLLGGGAVALLLGGITFWTMSGQRTEPRRTAPPVTVPATPTPVVLPAPIAPAPLAPPTGLQMPSVPSVALTPVPRPTEPTQRAPIMVFDASAPAATAETAAGTATPGAAPAAAPAGGGSGDNDEFAARVGGGGGAAGGASTAMAAAMANPATTVTQGTLIAAVLETAIDTDLPGYVRAVVSRDVRSFDGSQVLVPRSSRLIGQYKSGLAAGQTRAYVIWTRLIRPDGASVALASPAVEFSGRSGLAGKVDGHFFKRFGSALLLSVVGGLGAIGSGGTSLLIGGGQSAASVAAGRDGAIPPTIRVRQGEPIRVFTARDLDFSRVAGEAVR